MLKSKPKIIFAFTNNCLLALKIILLLQFSLFTETARALADHHRYVPTKCERWLGVIKKPAVSPPIVMPDFDLSHAQSQYPSDPIYPTYRLYFKFQGEEYGQATGFVKRLARKHWVEYLRTEEARLPYQIFIHEGQYVDWQGHLICPDRPCFGLLIMDGRGRTYFSSKFKEGFFHHSSFLAGASLAFSGDAVIGRGRISSQIGLKSGHAPMPISAWFSYKAELIKNGMSIDDLSLIVLMHDGRKELRVAFSVDDIEHILATKPWLLNEGVLPDANVTPEDMHNLKSQGRWGRQFILESP